MKASSLIALVFLTGAAAIRRVDAQLVQQPVQSEVRVDGLFATNSALHAGLGLSIPAGIYVRTGLIGAVGGGNHGLESRLDLLGRFSLDPFRQNRWGPYGGAGISGRFRPAAAGGSHAYLLVYLGLEGPLAVGNRTGWVPAFELGLGGGTRVGIILRRGVGGRR